MLWGRFPLADDASRTAQGGDRRLSLLGARKKYRAPRSIQSTVEPAEHRFHNHITAFRPPPEQIRLVDGAAVLKLRELYSHLTKTQDV